MIVKKLFNIVALHSIAAKLTAMAVAGALFMVLVALTVLFIARAELATERTERAHAMVDAAWSMADGFKRAAESGAITEDEAKARFFAASSSMWFEGHANYLFIYDTETGLCVMNAGNPALIGKDVRGLKDVNGLPFASMMLDIAKQGEGTIRYAFPKGGAKTPLEKVAYVRGFAPWHLMIASAEYMTDLDATFWAMARTAAAVIGVLLLCSIGIAWAVARSVVTPLSRLKTRMAALSNGDLDFPVVDADRQDEIGEMARTVQVFKGAMIETNRLRAEQLDAEQRQMQQRKADMHRLADNFEGDGGRDHRNRVVGFDRTRSVGKHADVDGGSFAGAYHDGCSGFGGSFHQCADGGFGHGRTDFVGPLRSADRCRNWRGWPVRPSIRRAGPMIVSANCRRRQPESATSSN